MWNRFHHKDVLDLQWSADGAFLISGSVDNSCIVWDMSKGEKENSLWSQYFYYQIVQKISVKMLLYPFCPCICSSGSVHQILDSHSHYVQGVAWDPLAKYVASLSSDRTCRIYMNKPQAKTRGMEKINYVCQNVITKAEQPSVDDSKVRNIKSIFFFCELHIRIFGCYNLFIVSGAVCKEPSFS